MILVDFSTLAVSNLLADIQSKRIQIELDDDLMRHNILNTLRSYNVKFRKEYGRMVLCMDSRRYWRKDVFPQYKMNRKKDREKSKLDWNNIYRILNMVKQEIKDFLPYQIIEVDGAEGDDCIAVISKIVSENEKVLIISGDHDMLQLIKHNVDIWQPRLDLKYIWSLI